MAENIFTDRRGKAESDAGAVMKETRAYKAGQQMGRAITEMVNLMYQKQTAIKFLNGLLAILHKDISNRGGK